MSADRGDAGFVDITSPEFQSMFAGPDLQVPVVADKLYDKQSTLKNTMSGPSVGGKDLAETPWEAQAASGELDSAIDKENKIIGSNQSADAKAASAKRLKILQDEKNNQSQQSPTMAAQPMDAASFVSYIQNPNTNPVVKGNAVLAAIQSPEMQDDVVRRLKSASSDSDNVITGLMQSLGESKNLLNQQIKLSDSNAQLANRELVAKKQRADAIAADTYNAVARFGTDLTSADSLINQAAVKNTQDFQAAAALKDQIRQKQAVGFLDNPAEWLLNQFTVGGLIDQHNLLAERVSDRNQFIDAQNRTVELAKTANAGKLSTMSTEEVSAQSQINLNNAQLDATKAKMAQLVNQGHTVEQARAISQSTTAFLTGEQLKAQQMQNNEQQKILINESRQNTEETKQEDRQRKRRTEEEQTLLDNQVADSLKDTGLPIKTQKQFNALPKDVKETLLPLLSKSADGTIGNTPSEALAVAKLSGTNLPANDSQKTALRLMAKAQQDVVTATANESKKPEEKKAEVDKLIKSQFDSLQNNLSQKIAVGQVQYNPYSPTPIMETLPWMPANNQFVVAANAVGTTLPKGVELTTGMVMQQIAQSIVENKIDPATAAKDVAAYAQKQIDNNNKTTNFRRYGLPEQTTFKQDLPFEGGQKVNLADPTVAIKALWKMSTILRQTPPEILGQ